MKLLKKLIIALAVMAVPFSLTANDGWYTTVGAGMSIAGKSNANQADGPTKYTLSSKKGYNGGIALGYYFTPSFRVEAQVSYLNNNLKDVKEDGNSVIGTAKFDGQLNSWSTMANAYYDIDLDSVVKPYVGLGLGLANTKTKIEGTFSGTAFEIKKSKSSLAYQGIVGTKYEINEDASLSLEYRYFKANSYKIAEKNSTNDYKIDYARHLIVLGLTFGF
jgi:opacity protein-like surface antigen